MPQFFFGIVIRGLGKGKDFGFPTANIKLNDSDLSIEKGIYAVSVNIDNQLYKGMLYVGTRPTLEMQEITIEIHILEFDKDIYNKQISFQILHKIRDEINFNSIEKLIEQLHQDKEKVYIFFTNY
ncbi:MAG: riboflavin kinase [Bacteroidetes bacterium]|nr:riboflavin kinase [Bacteroidota bacterium]MCL1969457.1 riboflavin kinase [Bacteroidota bacterium]